MSELSIMQFMEVVIKRITKKLMEVFIQHIKNLNFVHVIHENSAKLYDIDIFEVE